MPYIKEADRPGMNQIVDYMYYHDAEPDGRLNYVLYKYCKTYIKPSYSNYKNFIGELEECVVEIRRSILGPYEEAKKEENGDI
jgi:hypothetical protein